MKKNTAAQGKHVSFSVKVFVGMVLGAVIGLILQPLMDLWFVHTFLVNGVFFLVGKIFLSFLTVMVIPIVFTSLTLGILNLNDAKSFGRVGIKVVGIYLVTTALAIAIAIVAGKIFHAGAFLHLTTSEVTFSAKEAPSVVQVILGIFPTNVVSAMAKGKMLQVLVAAIFFGIGLLLVREKAGTVIKFVEQINDVFLRILQFLLSTAPYGVFAILAGVFAKTGFRAFEGLGTYILALVAALAFQMFITYGAIVRVLAGVSARKFFKKVARVWLVAFSTSSSNATIPVNLENSVDRLGADKTIASFAIPFGATVNMDGTAMMQGVAVVFIAHIFGIPMTLLDYMTVIGMATLASIGTAGVPSAGLVTLAIVLRQVNLPVEGIAIILGVDRLLDMTRTAVNVTGDAACCLAVSRWEGKLDKKKFNAPHAAVDHVAGAEG